MKGCENTYRTFFPFLLVFNAFPAYETMDTLKSTLAIDKGCATALLVSTGGDVDEAIRLWHAHRKDEDVKKNAKRATETTKATSLVSTSAAKPSLGDGQKVLLVRCDEAAVSTTSAQHCPLFGVLRSDQVTSSLNCRIPTDVDELERLHARLHADAIVACIVTCQMNFSYGYYAFALAFVSTTYPLMTDFYGPQAAPIFALSRYNFRNFRILYSTRQALQFVYPLTCNYQRNIKRGKKNTWRQSRLDIRLLLITCCRLKRPHIHFPYQAHDVCCILTGWAS